MAFNVQKIHPLDLEARKAIGIQLPFTSPSVFISTFQTKDAIKTNLLNFLLTEPGERYLNPTFGSYLQRLLFEPLTEETPDNVARGLREILSQNFPRIEATDIKVIPLIEISGIQIIIRYKVTETNIEDELIINVEV